MNKFLLLATSVMMSGLIGFSQQQSASAQSGIINNFSNQTVRIVDDKGIDGLSITYSVFEFSRHQETVDGNIWDKLTMDGFSHIHKKGFPNLPATTELIIIPEGATYDISYESNATTSYTGYQIYPTLRPATDRYGDPEPEFEYDTAFYNSNSFFPENPVRVVDIQDIRGMKMIIVEVSPVQFNPLSGEIRIHNNLSVEISFSNATRFLNPEDHSKDFLDRFNPTITNYSSIKSEIDNWIANESYMLNLNDNSKNYIIITDSLFYNAAEDFAQWKRQLGYSVELIVSTNWTSNRINDTVHDLYNQWSPKPDYLLLIGDHQFVPAKMLINSANDPFGTDLYYVTMGGPGDYVPEMAKGRISCSTPYQANIIIQKIINYEKNPVQDSAFYQTALNCAQFQDDDYDSYADRRFTHTSEEIRDYVISQGYDVKRVYFADLTSTIPLYYNASYYSNGQALPGALTSASFDWNGNASKIASKINSGAFYVLHRDHGYAGGSGWHAPNFTLSGLNMLSNGNKLPVVFSVNCHTGEFTLNECFAEKFQRLPNAGAVGVVAASYYSYSGWNDGLSAGMFDAIWATPGLIPNFGSGGLGMPNVQAHGDIRTMGDVVNHGLLRMTQTWGYGPTSTKYTYELFHYFGDPAMRIRTQFPQTITASHADSISCSSPGFVVSGCTYGDAVASLSTENQIIGRVTLSNGIGTIPITPFSASYLLLTISGPEHIPYIDTIWVVPDLLSVTYSVNNISCHGGSNGEIMLDIYCGTYPISISWSTGDSVEYVSGLQAGSYIFSITDNSNSTYTDTIVLTEPAVLLGIAGVVNNTSCYFGANGSIDLTITGGIPPYSYSWSNGHSSEDLNSLPAKQYIVTVTDDAGCIVTDTFIVSQPDPLIVNASAVHDNTNSCTGSATALPTGGTPPFTYLWDDPATQTTKTATGLCPGLVKVFVTDSNQCITVKALYIYDVSGIEEYGKLPVTVYPNPVFDRKITIEGFSQNHGEINVSFYSLVGDLILSKQFYMNAGGFIQNIDLANSKFAAGTYIMKIENEQGLVNEFKIVLL